MSNQICACDAGKGNMGIPNCDKVFRAAKKFVFVSQFSSAGVEACIDPVGTTLSLAWATALANNADMSLRLFFTPPLKNVKMIKGDPTFETFEDKSSNFVAEDIRKVTAILPECPPRLKANIEQLRCNNDTYAYAVDLLGNLIGCKKYDDGKLYPFPINPKSVYAGVMMAEDGSSQQLGLSFEIPNWFDDSTLCMIGTAAFYNFNLNSMAGLLDGNVTFSASGISSTIIVATITTPGSDLNDPIPVEGLVAADFISSVTGTTSKIRDTTAGADVSITGVTELNPGSYQITFTASVTKTMVLVAKLNGFDFYNMRSVSFVTL